MTEPRDAKLGTLRFNGRPFGEGGSVVKMRVGVIVLAGLGLCLTVLPDIASASGPSASTGTGTVTGTVSVTGAPTGFSPAYIGAAACPGSEPTGSCASNPTYTLASNGVYSLSLTAGTYTVVGFYENNGFGGAFLSAGHVVTVTSGGTVDLNLQIPYEQPAAITGTVTITGVPSSVTITELEVLLCPAFDPYTGGTIPIACVTALGHSSTSPTTGTYSVSGLPPGSWTAYATFCTNTTCGTPNPKDGTAVTLVAGKTSTVDVTGKFLAPGQSFVSGSVTVTGAPTGFSDQVGLRACPATGTCQTIYNTSGGSYGLILTTGTWTLTGFYLAAPFYNAIDGLPVTLRVTATSRPYRTRDLVVPYHVLGGATGTIAITGRPAGVSITSYDLLACPSADPWNGVDAAAPECVSEYSGPGGFGYGPADRNQGRATSPAQNPPAGYAGPAQAPANFNVYSLSTLTAGTWLLYPGYADLFGTVLSPTPTSVTIGNSAVTDQNLSVAYKTPTQGAVTGTIDVIGSPTGGNSAGAQACTAAPSGTTCQGEQQAPAQTGGGYTLLLAPGTWWVRGFVYAGVTEVTSPAVELQVSAGQHAKEDFTVTY